MEDVTHELLTRLKKLSPMQQQQVLDYTRTLLGEPIKGTPGKDLVKLVGLFPPEDIAEMKQAIEEEWGQVNAPLRT